MPANGTSFLEGKFGLVLVTGPLFDTELVGGKDWFALGALQEGSEPDAALKGASACDVDGFFTLEVELSKDFGIRFVKISADISEFCGTSLNTPCAGVNGFEKEDSFTSPVTEPGSGDGSLLACDVSALGTADPALVPVEIVELIGFVPANVVVIGSFCKA